MKKTLLLGLAALALSCIKENGTDGPPAQRYRNQLFDEVNVTTVEYSDVHGLQMDIYTPAGDNETNRPLVILAHGGAFVYGDRQIGEMQHWCTRLAQRGYVAASISYRLAGSVLDMLDTLSSMDVVLKAVGDGKAAVRWFRKSAASGNPFNIDPNRIFAGGTSAGAVLYLHAAYMDDTLSLAPHIRALVRANGGLAGNGGNSGYPDEVSGIINLSGGLHRTSWLEAGEPPLVSAHGSLDGTVPFGCGDVFQGSLPGYDLVDLCGSQELHNRAQQVGVESRFKVFPGADHCPWLDANGNVNQLADEIEPILVNFLADHL